MVPVRDVVSGSQILTFYFTYCLVLAVFCFRMYGKAQENIRDIEGDMRSMSIATAVIRLGQVFPFL